MYYKGSSGVLAGCVVFRQFLSSYSLHSVLVHGGANVTAFNVANMEPHQGVVIYRGGAAVDNVGDVDGDGRSELLTCDVDLVRSGGALAVLSNSDKQYQ